MAKKPELVKISATEYRCSECGFKVEILKPSKITQAQWDARLQRHLATHIKQSHSSEDFSQAAARIVKEATENS